MEILRHLGELSSDTISDPRWITAIIGLGVCIGMLVASRRTGAAVLVLAAAAAGVAPDFPELVAGLVALLVALVLVNAPPRPIVAGESQASGEAIVASASLRDRLRPVLYALAIACAAVTAAVALGVAGSAWDRFRSPEQLAAIVLAVCAIPAAIAAHRFIFGSVAAGALSAIVETVVAAVAAVAAAISLFIPYAGVVFPVLATVMWLRQRRTLRAKYKGLRILS